MNYLLHRQKVPKQTAKLPEGLSELMSDISREVLRENPDNAHLYKFIADYLDALLTTRQRTFVAKEILDDILESSVLIGELLSKNGIDFKKASKAASVIQGEFRNYVQQKQEAISISKRAEFNEFELFRELVLKCDFKEYELVTVKGIIRSAFRDFFRKYSNTLKTAFVCGHSVWPAVENTLKYHADKMPSFEDMNKAATKIQAYYRRYSVQKNLRKKYPCFDGRFRAEESKSNVLQRVTKAAKVIQNAFRTYKDVLRRRQEKKDDWRYQESLFHASNAATKIQAIFRGYKVRKAMRCSEQVKDTAHVSRKKYAIMATAPQQEIMRKLEKGRQEENERYLREGAARKLQIKFRKLLAKSQVEAMNAAAVKIQQLFRKIKQKEAQEDENLPKHSSAENKLYEQREKAAGIIQASWRDFSSRRDFINEIYNIDEIGVDDTFDEKSVRNQFERPTIGSNLEGSDPESSSPAGHADEISEDKIEGATKIDDDVAEPGEVAVPVVEFSHPEVEAEASKEETSAPAGQAFSASTEKVTEDANPDSPLQQVVGPGEAPIEHVFPIIKETSNHEDSPAEENIPPTEIDLPLAQEEKAPPVVSTKNAVPDLVRDEENEVE